MSRLALFLAFTLAVPVLAFAQDERPDGEPTTSERAEIENRIQMMRVFALTDALALDEATATRLFPYLRTGDERQRELHQEQKMAKQDLRKLVEAGGVTDSALDATVSRIADSEIALTKARQEQFAGLKTILTPDQRAKFFVAQQKFDREMRRRLREIRREERGDRRERRERRRGELD